MHEAEQLLGAYALGALDPDERVQLESHLKTCDDCRGALESLESIASGLLHAVPARSPRPAVRARLISQLDRSERRPSWVSWLRAQPLKVTAALAAVFLLVASNLALLLQTRSLLETEQAALDQQRAGQVAIAIASYPNSEVALIDQNEIRGTFVYDPELPVAVLYVWGLDPPAAGRAYQAWLIREDGSRINGGLVRHSPEDGLAWLMIQAPAPIGQYTGFGVTIEPKEGSITPTGDRVLGADL